MHDKKLTQQTLGAKPRIEITRHCRYLALNF